MQHPPILFIINKVAGKGFLPTVEGKILDICEHYQAECTIEFTRSKGHATELAKEGIAKGFKKIVAIGGDGTLNEVAQALVHTEVTMGIVPKGSGNGLSRHLGIPLNFEKAVEAVFTGHPVLIDTFLLNDHLSINVSGVGFDGHVANLFGKDGKRGLLGYVKLTLQEFFKFDEYTGSLTIDGKTHSIRAFILAIANSAQYGNNARIAPLASVTDHKLHITLLSKVPLYSMLPFMLRFFGQRVYDSAYCQTYEGRAVQLFLEKSIAYHVDGEPTGSAKEFSIKVQPASLRMLVPNPAAKI
jgi:diacylglycerol kinase (ATP)